MSITMELILRLLWTLYWVRSKMMPLDVRKSIVRTNLERETADLGYSKYRLSMLTKSKKNNFLITQEKERLRKHIAIIENELKSYRNNFKFSLPKNYTKNNPLIIEEIKQNFESMRFGYCFLGKVGCGKTYLSEIIITQIRKFFLDKKTEGSVADRYSLSSVNAEFLYKKYLQEPKSFKFNAKADILFIDDVGAGFDTEAYRKFIGWIIKERYVAFKRKKEGDVFVTLLTTNLNINKIMEFFGDRVFDRIVEMTTFMNFKNDSMRTSKFKQIG